VLPLNKILGDKIITMFYKVAAAFANGKLSQHLEKTSRPGSRNSRSVSASAVPHGGHSSQRSGVGTDSDPITSQNEASTPSERTSHRSRLTTSRHEHSTISSSDPEFSMILKREAKILCEQNKNFIDPAFVTRDSNSSHSPSTSRSNDFVPKQDYRGNYDENEMQGFYYQNGYYYPPPVYANNAQFVMQPSQFARNWQPTFHHQAQAQYYPIREEAKKLDPSAPAYEQKRKIKPQFETITNAPAKEEKKEVLQLDAKHIETTKAKGGRRPLGNAAENTIRQIINRRKLNIRQVKAKDESQSAQEKECQNRRAKSKEYVKYKNEEDYDEIESDAYTQEENTQKKKVVSMKLQFSRRIIKSSVHCQNQVKIKDAAASKLYTND
jgi:hypothetical protein